MSRIRNLTSVGLVIVVLLLLAITTACGDDGGSGLFGYDDDAPLSIQTVDSWQDGNVRSAQPEFRFIVDYTVLFRPPIEAAKK